MATHQPLPRPPARGLFSDLVRQQVARKVATADATCVNCGCTDSRACPGGCYWISVCRMSQTGLCSGCLA